MEKVVRRRVTLLLFAVLALAVGIGARLTYLQVYCCTKLRGRASVQHWRELEAPAIRGALLDRQGRELAVSLKTESLFAHARRVEDPEKAARLLAPILDASQSEILERLRSNKPFVYLDRFLEPDEAARVRQLDLPIGNTKPFGFLPSSKRYYPWGKLAVHVLGFANIDGEGVEGAEKQFDDALRSDPTHYLVLHDGLNGQVKRRTIDPPRKEPRDLILTIDAVLQHIAERELDDAMRSSGARGASAVLLDPATGEVLALANRPAADPNRYGSSSDEERINRAVVHQYEPGSTFKIVTMAAALEHGSVRPDQWIDCEQGSYTFQGRTVHDISRHGSLSTRQVLEKSSNIGMVKIVRGVDRRDLRDTIVRFGFGSQTGIELPGELPGNLRRLEDWSNWTSSSLSFGYEIGVTVLQMASALGVIAHDGVRAPLSAVLGLRDAEGRVQLFDRRPPYRVLDRAIARELTAMMEGVVLRGTGTAARLRGYRVAGKSGTARKVVDGRYSNTHTIASFGGFAPLSSPRLVCLVVIDTPLGDRRHGGQVAAPVFRRIMEDALSYVRARRDDDLRTLADAKGTARTGGNGGASR